MENNKYNGWTNYETWCVALWLDNDSGSAHYVAALAEAVYDAAEADRSFTREERAALELADRLKEEIEEHNPLAGQATLYTDLLNTALAEVNFYEIAQNVLTDQGLREAGHGER